MMAGSNSCRVTKRAAVVVVASTGSPAAASTIGTADSGSVTGSDSGVPNTGPAASGCGPGRAAARAARAAR
jgi:hypothetical protein